MSEENEPVVYATGELQVFTMLDISAHEQELLQSDKINLVDLDKIVEQRPAWDTAYGRDRLFKAGIKYQTVKKLSVLGDYLLDVGHVSNKIESNETGDAEGGSRRKKRAKTGPRFDILKFDLAAFFRYYERRYWSEALNYHVKLDKMVWLVRGKKPYNK